MADEGHPVAVSFLADAAQHGDLLLLIVTAQDAAHRHGIGTHGNGFFHTGHLHIALVMVDAKGGQLEHKTGLARVGSKAVFCNALMHGDGIRTAGHHLSNGIIDGIQTFHHTTAHGMVYSQAEVLTVLGGHQALETNFFSNHNAVTSLLLFTQAGSQRS